MTSGRRDEPTWSRWRCCRGRADCRQDLLKLLDQVDASVAELTAAIEQEAVNRPPHAFPQPHALVKGNRVQLVPQPGLHLHQAMPMPQQSP